ncbi:MAG: HD domain-containing protein [Nitrospirae bacterium]|nr:HD domain-containing protein [Nitrospirota bacterium]
MFKFKSLTAKYLFVSIIFVGLFTVFISSASFFARYMKGDARRINLAGRERMLTLSIVSHMHFIASKPTSAAVESHIKVARDKMAEYEQTLYGLRDGDIKLNVRQIHKHDKALVYKLNELIGLWEKIQKPVLLGIISNPAGMGNSGCDRCHSAVRNNLPKVEDFVKSLETHYEDELENFDTFRLGFLGVFLVVSVVMVRFVRRDLIMPVKQLADAASKIGKGDFGGSVDIKSSDEIGMLGNAFNNMADSLQKSFNDLQTYSQELLALNTASNKLIEIQSTENLYKKLCAHAKDLFNLKMTWIGLIKEGDHNVYPVASAGLDDNYLSTIKITYDDSATGNGPVGMSIKKRKPVKSNTGDVLFSLWREEAEKRGFNSVAGVPLITGDTCLGSIGVYSDKHDYFDGRRLDLLQIFANHGATVIENASLMEYIVFALARAAEVNDEDTGNHILRVGEYCAAIARRMGLSDTFCSTMKVQATLHDVGKIHISPDILKKPGKLTDKEWSDVKQHPVMGAKIVGDHRMLKTAKTVALFHHERWDGSGYPHGLKGQQIPVEARIMNIADQYDALRSCRPYKPAYDHDTSYRIILDGDGRTIPGHFDPDVHSSFIHVASELEAIYEELKG